ncbi:hypothetical protein CL6EHI_063560 [Entamoeba histolytica]|uniref:Uncharacterized protein n=2 Tax=Entamoeba histolytica TaxID=5759 RepID=C4MBJ1_ENTH1|nr:hypothetical protein EHI_063560 [Entamoeba histolytica HM-1:IMSS]EAL42829.1 hypothetical protein EHI_063560 [Entamoeba histolytica HM-1:IMSS]GAT99383.1 hypothetical protein CL6EHI_063560 [Entamoeba histolytica]|eukprot:XP_648216.1 hypothetical protein EHI_063560 [Entamoeba histolytica HM-1:IMSS]
MEKVKTKKLCFKDKDKKPKKRENKEDKAEETKAQMEQKMVLQKRRLEETKKGEKGYQEKRKELNERLSKQTDINDLFRTNCSWIERVEHL